MNCLPEYFRWWMHRIERALYGRAAVTVLVFVCRSLKFIWQTIYVSLKIFSDEKPLHSKAKESRKREKCGKTKFTTLMTPSICYPQNKHTNNNNNKTFKRNVNVIISHCQNDTQDQSLSLRSNLIIILWWRNDMDMRGNNAINVTNDTGKTGLCSKSGMFGA